MIKDKDSLLLEKCRVPFLEIHETLDAIKQLRDFFGSKSDNRAAFLTAYYDITSELAQWIDEGKFLDPELMKAYLVAFANYYRNALLQYELKNFDQVPTAWKIAFDKCQSSSSSGIQNLILGINAHINHDLPLTMRDVGIKNHCKAHKTDHERVNKALAIATPGIRDKIVFHYHQEWKIQNKITGFQLDLYMISVFRDIRKCAWNQGIVHGIDKSELDQISKESALNILRQRTCISKISALRMNFSGNWINYIPITMGSLKSLINRH